MNDPQYLNHEEVHASIEIWCVEAATLMGRLVNQIEALEHRVNDLHAIVREWEVKPR